MTDRISRLELDIDVRLRDVWMYAYDLEMDDYRDVGVLIRAAYAQGYHDHATEPVENLIYREYGYKLPQRQGVG